MRTRMIVPTLLLLTLAVPASAWAQASDDQQAVPLPAQGQVKPSTTKPAPKPAPTAKPAPAKPAPAPTTTPTTPPTPTKPQPSAANGAASHAIPTGPGPVNSKTPLVPPLSPPAPVVPPPIVVPMRTPAPVIAAIVTADAPGVSQPLKGGIRLTFGPGRSDLNPATQAAIIELVRGSAASPAPGPTTSFTITTYAAGQADDPSTPRRLSLSRGLAVRSVLISQGIASVRIYVKAWGPASAGFADGPADRADIIVAPNPVQPPAKTP